MQVSNTLKRTLPPRARGGCLQIGAQLNLSLADEDLAEKKKLRVWNAWQWGAPAFVALIVLVIVVVRLFQGKTASVPGIPGSGR